MIINTGCRTDIPAYYSEWFFNRIKAGYVLSRNPYYPEQVSHYTLSPGVVSVLCFCTKNPEPMLKRMNEIAMYRQFWFVTITPYGKEIEPNVPDKSQVIESFQKLSQIVGINAISWRYDPIFISEKYSIEFHLKQFEKMAQQLSGYVDSCVISFIDLYEKTKRNFCGIREVTKEEQEKIGNAFSDIGRKNGIRIRTCCEGEHLEKYGVDISGCMTKQVLERAAGGSLNIPKGKKTKRERCNCVLGSDIGMYNTCKHGCRYCYANYDWETVVENFKLHNPEAPLLIGKVKKSDQIKNAKQTSYYEGQLSLFVE